MRALIITFSLQALLTSGCSLALKPDRVSETEAADADGAHTDDEHADDEPADDAHADDEHEEGASGVASDAGPAELSPLQMCAALGSVCHESDDGGLTKDAECHDVGHALDGEACEAIYAECIAHCKKPTSDAGNHDEHAGEADEHAGDEPAQDASE